MLYGNSRGDDGISAVMAENSAWGKGKTRVPVPRPERSNLAGCTRAEGLRELLQDYESLI